MRYLMHVQIMRYWLPLARFYSAILYYDACLDSAILDARLDNAILDAPLLCSVSFSNLFAATLSL